MTPAEARTAPPRAVLFFCAVLCAHAGQALLDSSPFPEWVQRAAAQPPAGAAFHGGWGLLAVGLLLSALSYRGHDGYDLLRRSGPSHAPTPRPQRRERAISARLALELGLLLAATCLSAYNTFDYATRGESSATRWQWLLSIALLVFSQIGVATRGEPVPARGGLPPVRVATLLATGVVAIGFSLRFVDLVHLPLELHGDAASMGLGGRDILEGRAPGLFSVGWAAIPWLGFLPAAAGLRVFGDSLFGLNMSGVIAGTATLVGIYRLATTLFGRETALVATAVAAVGYTDIHFSRVAAYMDPVPWMVLGLDFGLRGLRSCRRFSIALSGVLLAIGFEMYFSGRLTVFILAAFVVYLLVLHPRALLSRWDGLVLFLLAFAVATGPMAVYFLRHPDLFAERSRVVFLFYPAVMEHLMSKYGVDSAGAVFLEQMRLSFLTFFKFPDSSTQFGFRHPMLSPLFGPWLVLGIGYSVAHWRRAGHALLLIWLTLAIVMGSVLTGDAPFWPRLVILLPPLAVGVGLGLHRLAEAVHTRVRIRRLAPVAAWTVVVVVVGWTGVINWRWYTQDMRVHVNPRTWLGRQIAESPAGERYCMAQGPQYFAERETAFLTKGRDLLDFPPNDLDTMVERCLAEGRTWVLIPPDHDWLRIRLEALDPEGRSVVHNFPSGWPGPTFWTPSKGAVQRAATGHLRWLPAPAPATGIAWPEIDPALGLVYLGTTDSRAYEIDLGELRVSGKVRVTVRAVRGFDAVYDYVVATTTHAPDLRFEAEDPRYTSGDSPVDAHAPDGHWWRQEYDGFSREQGLVALKNESVPPLVTELALTPGRYFLKLGSFTGDTDNGVFALQVLVEAPPP